MAKASANCRVGHFCFAFTKFHFGTNYFYASYEQTVVMTSKPRSNSPPKGRRRSKGSNKPKRKGSVKLRATKKSSKPHAHHIKAVKKLHGIADQIKSVQAASPEDKAKVTQKMKTFRKLTQQATKALSGPNRKRQRKP